VPSAIGLALPSTVVTSGFVAAPAAPASPNCPELLFGVILGVELRILRLWLPPAGAFGERKSAGRSFQLSVGRETRSGLVVGGFVGLEVLEEVVVVLDDEVGVSSSSPEVRNVVMAAMSQLRMTLGLSASDGDADVSGSGTVMNNLPIWAAIWSES